jgi:hypothetical protein
MNITFEHGWVEAKGRERPKGLPKDECYELHLHSDSKHTINQLWDEVRHWLNAQGAIHTILINKYNRKGKGPYCLCWKSGN